MSLTGITWIIAGSMMNVLAAQMLAGVRENPNPVIKRFGWFFLWVGLAFYAFSAPLFTSDGSLLHVAVLAGQLALIIAYAFAADASWIFYWKQYVPRWLMHAALALNAILTTAVLLTASSRPYKEPVGELFAVTIWNFTNTTFLATIVFMVPIAFLIGTSLIIRARSLAGQARARGLVLGYGFYLGSLFGYLTTAPFLPVFIIIGNMVFQIILFSVLLVIVFFYKPAKAIRKQLEKQLADKDHRSDTAEYSAKT